MTFQQRKHGKVSSNVPSSADNMIHCPLGCRSSGENVIQCLPGWLSSGEIKMLCPLSCPTSGENMIQYPLWCFPVQEIQCPFPWSALCNAMASIVIFQWKLTSRLPFQWRKTCEIGFLFGAENEIKCLLSCPVRRKCYFCPLRCPPSGVVECSLAL